MRFNGNVVVLWAVFVLVLCASVGAAPAAETAPAEDKDKMGLSSNAAVDLLAVNTDTVHENESNRKARQFFYPYGGYYGGYGGYYGGYGGYGLYGYRLYPSYGYGYYPYSGYYPYYG
ncbi:uncharacterized protein LOC129914904 [Episyrphus balteatus]|uniref:uncharacterized protein LOC129914904 n=1 Tax=Episyrphus balteatus TaxID=286459 RepID=UPI002484DA8E|nr:uncharacterized protein LOC129914904 [Episyrphus balteatus]